MLFKVRQMLRKLRGERDVSGQQPHGSSFSLSSVTSDVSDTTSSASIAAMQNTSPMMDFEQRYRNGTNNCARNALAQRRKSQPAVSIANASAQYVPGEIIFNILSFANEREVRQYSLVCKAWYEEAHHAAMYRELLARLFRDDPDAPPSPECLAELVSVLAVEFQPKKIHGSDEQSDDMHSVILDPCEISRLLEDPGSRPTTPMTPRSPTGSRRPSVFSIASMQNSRRGSRLMTPRTPGEPRTGGERTVPTMLSLRPRAMDPPLLLPPRFHDIDWSELYEQLRPSRWRLSRRLHCGENLDVSPDGSYVRTSMTNEETNFSVQTTRAMQPRKNAFYFFEVRIVENKRHNLAIGLADEYFKLRENFVGYPSMRQNTPSWSYSSNGMIRVGLGTHGNPIQTVKFEPGDRVGFLVDFLKGHESISFYKNGNVVPNGFRIKMHGVVRDGRYRPTITMYSRTDELELPRDLSISFWRDVYPLLASHPRSIRRKHQGQRSTVPDPDDMIDAESDVETEAEEVKPMQVDVPTTRERWTRTCIIM